jgi:hypothetical protein
MSKTEKLKHITKAEREANKAFRPLAKTATEYESAQNAFHANRERLKAERLAREAAVVENPPHGEDE